MKELNTAIEKYCAKNQLSKDSLKQDFHVVDVRPVENAQSKNDHLVLTTKSLVRIFLRLEVKYDEREGAFERQGPQRELFVPGGTVTGIVWSVQRIDSGQGLCSLSL